MLQISVLLCLLLPQLAWSWYGNIKNPFISFLPYVSGPLISFFVCMDLLCLHIRFVFWQTKQSLSQVCAYGAALFIFVRAYAMLMMYLLQFEHMMIRVRCF
jgi:hypothetical protein